MASIQEGSPIRRRTALPHMFPVFSEGAGGQSRAQREAAAAPETIKTAASQLRRG